MKNERVGRRRRKTGLHLGSKRKELGQELGAQQSWKGEFTALERLTAGASEERETEDMRLQEVVGALGPAQVPGCAGL